MSSTKLLKAIRRAAGAGTEQPEQRRKQVLWESDNWPGTRVEPNVTCLTWMPTGVRHAGDQKSTKKGSTASSITSLPSSSSENSETNNHKPTTTWSCGRGDLRRGFLGAGSESGTVGITRTDISPFASVDIPHDKRLNFNLRGHASQISLVAWNVPQKKLASCDEAGVIYVWMPNDERWIVELVNDRGVKVRDFCWSPNGSCALICYEDNFVLIGSATGQRIWSHSFQQTVLCGVWAHDSREIVIGLSTGGIQVITEQGATVTERTVWADHPIERLACSAQRASGGVVHFLRSYDDADATVFVPEGTNVKVVGMQWSISGEHLALATVSEESKHAAVVNHLHIFNGVGARLLSTVVPLPGTGPQRRLTAFTWAHDDRAVVLAANDGHVLTGRLVHGVASLSTLASYRVWSLLDKKQMAHRTAVDELPLPKREKIMVKLLDDHLVQCRVPSPVDLMNFACRPTPWRWYCTIRPAPRKPQCYVLCMEHIGGLIPVLIGRQINRLLPEFEIRLPVSSYTSSSARSKSRKPSTSRSRSRTPEKSAGEADEREPSDTPSPFQRSTLKRNSVWRTSKRKLRAIVHNLQSSSVGAGAGPSCSAGSSDLISAAGDERLVQVSSNVWCTRFKVTGMLATVLPPYLAQVVYKTSVLHLQPRQMTVHLVDLERRTALTAPVAPPIDNDAADGGTDDNLLENQSDLGPPVAPSDGEIFAGGNFNNINNNNNNNNNFAEEEAGAFTNEGDELLVREHELLHQVSLEFTDLRLAVESHINRMKDFAADLQRSSIQLKTGGRRAAKGTDHPSSSLLLPRRSTTPLPAAPAFKDQAFVERKTAGCAHASVTSSVAKTATGQEQWVPPTPPADQSWQSKLDAIEFIDEDESLVVTSELERQRLRPRTLSASTDCDSRLNGVSGAIGRSSTDAPPTSSTARDANNDPPAYYAFSRPASLAMSGKGGAKQLNEISTVLDKLYKLANELTARPAVLKQTVSDGGRTAGTGKTTATTKSMLAVAADGVDGVSELRNRIREIAQRVSQLEKRINHGNDLLDEVRGDLHQRVQHIRVVLGEFSENTGAVDSESLPRIVCSAPSTSRASSAEPTSSTAVKKSSDTKTNQQELGRVFVLHNKTPFWNEQSQVYQLDFGGRVTQESAKNFQIEHQGVQVMQFGRIENGAYTLDFRSPFSAVQSYAVALASITQRLK